MKNFDSDPKKKKKYFNQSPIYENSIFEPMSGTMVSYHYFCYSAYTIWICLINKFRRSEPELSNQFKLTEFTYEEVKSLDSIVLVDF